jgi:hypothetical protein
MTMANISTNQEEGKDKSLSRSTDSSSELDLLPLPADFKPENIQILYFGVPVYDSESFPNLQINPSLQVDDMELIFDGQPVLIKRNGKIIVNRCENLGLIDL